MVNYNAGAGDVVLNIAVWGAVLILHAADGIVRPAEAQVPERPAAVGQSHRELGRHRRFRDRRGHLRRRPDQSGLPPAVIAIVVLLHNRPTGVRPLRSPPIGAARLSRSTPSAADSRLRSASGGQAGYRRRNPQGPHHKPSPYSSSARSRRPTALWIHPRCCWVNSTRRKSQTKRWLVWATM